MHDPIKEAARALRVSARSLRSTADVDESQGFATLAGHGREVAAGRDRAADLLEALASPPETVEELERRAGELWGLNVFAEEIDDGVYISTGAARIRIDNTSVGAEAECVRAAWFAIVGMMEAPKAEH